MTVTEQIIWISVCDRLPDDEITVLVCHPSMNEPVWFGYHEDNSWYTADGYWLEGAVTHWAEMPAGVQVNE